MSIKTINIEDLGDELGNRYELLAVISKRARQIAAREKLELDEKLKYFEGFEDEEEMTFNEEQERISKEYEIRLHPGRRALDDLLSDDLSYEYPSLDE